MSQTTLLQHFTTSNTLFCMTSTYLEPDLHFTLSKTDVYGPHFLHTMTEIFSSVRTVSLIVLAGSYLYIFGPNGFTTICTELP